MHIELCGQASSDGLYHVITKDYVYVDMHHSAWEIKCMWKQWIPRPFLPISGQAWKHQKSNYKCACMLVCVCMCLSVCACVNVCVHVIMEFELQLTDFLTGCSLGSISLDFSNTWFAHWSGVMEPTGSCDKMYSCKQNNTHGKWYHVASYGLDQLQEKHAKSWNAQEHGHHYFKPIDTSTKK